ncbi:MAG: hypothetical protein M1467_00240 [Deltaproteobacteria bacterium]|jgi:hypothetical protein|nr:hypothetical protein [Deltaproteobacteria bacterium]MCL5879590.1 hypothetical protein [Deltaproteobacteria bacterium]
MKIKEKINAQATKIENRLEEFEKVGNEKLKSAAAMLGEYADRKGLNTPRGKIIIVSVVILLFILFGGMFKVSFRPLRFVWINPITAAQKAFTIKRALGAVMPQSNNVPIPQTAGSGQYYRREALKIYKKVYKLDKAIQATGRDKKSKVNSGYSPSKAHKINKLDKKTQKNEKN